MVDVRKRAERMCAVSVLLALSFLSRSGSSERSAFVGHFGRATRIALRTHLRLLERRALGGYAVFPLPAAILSFCLSCVPAVSSGETSEAVDCDCSRGLQRSPPQTSRKAAPMRAPAHFSPQLRKLTLASRTGSAVPILLFNLDPAAQISCGCGN